MLYNTSKEHVIFMNKRMCMLGMLAVMFSSTAYAALPGSEVKLAENILELDRQLKIYREGTKLFEQKFTNDVFLVTDELQNTDEVMLNNIIVIDNKNVPVKYVLKRLKVKAGDKIKVSKLKKQVEFFNATNISGIKAELVNTSEARTATLKLKFIEPKHRSFRYMFVDNGGPENSGEYRVGLMSESYGFLHNDDRLYGITYFSKGVKSGYKVYDTPVSHHGTRAYLGLSSDKVRLKKGPLRDRDFVGRADDGYLGVNHPFIANKQQKLEGFAELHYKWGESRLPHEYKLENKTKGITGGIRYINKDNTGFNFVKLAVNGYKGEAELDSVDQNDKDGVYYNLFAIRRQLLPHKQYLQAKVYGQYAGHKDLPSSEHLEIGGMYSVRGYEENKLSGYKGYYGSLEYNLPLSKDNETIRAFVFYDYGSITNGLYSENKGREYISSYGVGFDFKSSGWHAKIALGIPLKHSEAITHDKTRTHFYMQKMF